MDTNYTAQLVLSMLFFAPGIILFVGLAFVGVLMVIEKTAFRANTTANLTQQPLDLPQTANPAPGAIVNALKDATQPQAQQTAKRKANQ